MVNFDAGALFSLEDRTVLLTGATGFLGRTFARTLLSNGARVIAVGRSDRIETMTAEWVGAFGQERVRGLRLDMYDLPAFSDALEQLAAEESVDVIVNNAYELSAATGFNTPEGTLEDASFEQWTRHFTSGIYWPALTVQKLGPGMKERRRGSIVNVSTMYALVAPDPRLYEGTTFLNPPGYSSAKAGTLAFTRYVASFWGGYGIRANAILPGPFSNTEDAGENSVDAADPFLERLNARTSLRRRGRPEELAGALLFLASDASSFVTGHALVVDGGWTQI